MKLDTSRADSLPPYVKGITDQGEEEDSLPEVFYAEWRYYLEANPIFRRDHELEEEYPDASRSRRITIYYSELRRHLQQTMFQWLDAHDGVVDRWPYPTLDGWGGFVLNRTNIETGTSMTTDEYPFELFAHKEYDVPNGFTNCDELASPEKPYTYTRHVEEYRKHYWDSYNKEKADYEFQTRVYEDYKKEVTGLKKGLRVTPLKVLALIILAFFALNGLVAFAYCFTGLFDYEKLVDGLYALTQSGALPVKILAWPVFILQYINYFLFRNFVPLRQESIAAIVIGYAILLVVLVCWLGVLVLAKNFIFSSGDPFGAGTKTDRKKLTKSESEMLAREKKLQDLKEKLDAEKARLQKAYQNDAKYFECVRLDQEKTRWMKESYPRRKKNYQVEREKYIPYRDMIRAYYDYLVKRGIVEDTLTVGDWQPNFIRKDLDY